MALALALNLALAMALDLALALALAVDLALSQEEPGGAWSSSWLLLAPPWLLLARGGLAVDLALFLYQ